MGLEGRRVRLTGRRLEMGFSLDGLARRLKVNKTTVTRWESGATEPQPAQRRALATALEVTDAEVRILLGLPPNELALVRESPAQTVSGEQVNNGEEAVETNRRELGFWAAGAAALRLRIGVSIGTPGRGELFSAESVVADLAARYTTTSHEALLGEVGGHWRAVEDILADGWRSDRYRDDFQIIAGQLTCLMARLAFNMGDYQNCAQFLDLVEVHLNASGDAGLGAALAGMWSSLLFYRGDYTGAVLAAQEGHRWNYKYDEGRLFGYEARALGALGDHPAALDALEGMERSTRSGGEPEAGGEPFTEEYSRAVRGHTLARLGKYKEAVEITGAAVAEYDLLGDAPYESHGNAYLSYAMALFGVDVEASAGATVRALDIIDGRPTFTVLKRAIELGDWMREYRGLRAVEELHARLSAVARPALSGGRPV